jgi:ATP-dependent helicase/nuclease subunit A
MALERLPESTVGRGLRLPSRRPSDADAGARLVPLFGRDGAGAADFGTRVHVLFETVEWWGRAQEATWLSARRAEGADDAALTEALGCLSDPALSAIFARPDGSAEVWRERAFEIVLDGVWLTGVFDRVVVERDAAGRNTRVRVIDFKTDRPGSSGDEIAAAAVGRHAGQLNLYRRVAAILAGVAVDRVTCTLLMTARRAPIDVPWPA